MRPTIDAESLYGPMHATNAAYRQRNQGLALWDRWRPRVALSGSILEVGCGNGKLMQRLAAEGFSVTGLDCIDNLYEIPQYYQHDVTDGFMPFGDKRFDWLLCFDVLEHLPERAIPYVLAECARVSQKMILSVAHYGGPPLHLTVKDIDWWDPLLSAIHGELVEIVARYNNPKTQVTLWIKE